LLKRIRINKANLLKLFILAKTVLKLINNNILLKKKDIYLYKQIIKLIIYLLNNTRPNIVYIIRQLTRFILVPIVTYL
jgi:hypothetical protein